jgi:DNA repair protein RecN (Recombination protein N)
VELDPLIDNFLEAHYSLHENAGEIARYLSSLEADPARFEYLQQRKSAITALLKKYGKGSDKSAAYLQLIEDGASASTRVKDLQGGDARLEELEAEQKRIFVELAKKAQALSEKRQKVAADLAEKVSV